MKRNNSLDDIRNFLNEKFRNGDRFNPDEKISPELSELWDLSGKALNTTIFPVRKGWQKFEDVHGLHLSKNRPIKKILLILLGLLLMVSLWVYFSTNGNEETPVAPFIAQFQLNYRQNLPDGSVIYYDDPDGLTTGNSFTALTRKINVKGNAFCRIASDAKHPFEIETPIGSITVHGTEFMIFQDNHSLSVEVLEGKVSLKHRESPELSATLSAGHQAKLFDDKRMLLVKSNTDDIELLQLIMLNSRVSEALELVSALQPHRLQLQSETIDKECRITSLWSLLDFKEIKSELELLFNAKVSQSGNQYLVQDLNCPN